MPPPTSSGRASTSLDLDELFARARATYPLPVADAVAALDAADNPHQRRDRVVECFRTIIRYHAALALAARLQFGPGPTGDGADLQRLLRSLRSRHLTDGQWVQLTRTLLKPWAKQPEGHPLCELVKVLCGPGGKRPPLGKQFDGLLEMRRVETVAHGGTGGAAEIEAVLARRLPQLGAVLDRLGAVWAQYRLAVPLARPEPGRTQRAWLLIGETPARARWRRIDLAAHTGESTADGTLQPGQPVLIDADARPLVALHPIALSRRPSPEAAEELFLLDGGGRRGARYVAFPSLAEHRESELWPALEPLLAGAEDADSNADTVAGLDRPYRGLHSFGAQHARLFFGRENQTGQLANRVRRHPFVTVTGQSGCGKSSLLGAGVFPRLADHRLVSLRPGPQPARALAAQLDDALYTDDMPRAFADVLETSPDALGVVLERSCRASGSRLILAIDQGEELFTLCDDDEQRDRFTRALASAGYDPDGPIRVVLSLREDFFARLATVEPLRGLYSRQVEIVTTPDRDALIRTLIAPASLFGYQLEDEELLADMVDPVVGEPAALALLQFCADQLWDARDRKWKRLTRAAYRRLGGVEGALATHAESVMAQLSPGQQRAARPLLLRLVTAEKTRAVVPRRELEAGAGDPVAAQAVVARLIDSRLLTVRESDSDDAGSVELVHEALIRHWDRLRDWLEEDHEFHIVRHRVASATAQWRAEGSGGDFLLGEGKPLADAERLLDAHPDLLSEHEVALIDASRRRMRRRTRLKQFAIAGLVVLAAAASVAAYLAAMQSERAQERQREANRRTDDLVLLRASEALDSDSAQALAWLDTLELDARTAPRARIITADALSRGQSVALLRFESRAPVQMAFADGDAGGRSDDHRLFYVGHGTRMYRHQLPGGPRVPLSAPHVHPFNHFATDPHWKHSAITSDGQIFLVDIEAGEEKPLALDIPKPLQAYPAADGRRILVFDHHGALWMASTDGSGTPQQVSAGPLSPRAPLIALAPAGDRAVVIADDGGGLLIAAPRDGPIETQTIAAPTSSDGAAQENRGITEIPVAGLSPSGRTVAIADLGGTMRLVSMENGEVHSLTDDPKAARRMLFSRDSSHMLVQRGDHVYIWRGPMAIDRVVIADLGVESLAISHDGSAIAAGSSDGAVYVWRVPRGNRVALRGHRDTAYGLAFSADGRHLATSSFDGDLRVWRLPEQKQQRIADDMMLVRFEDLRVADDGAVLGATDGTAMQFAADGKRLSQWPRAKADDNPFELDLPELDGSDGPDDAAVLGPAGKQVVFVGEKPELWRVGADAAVPLSSKPHSGAAISSTGLIALYRRYHPEIAIVTDTGTAVTELLGTAPAPGDAPRPRHLAFSPDGRWLIEIDDVDQSGAGGSIRRWSTETWKLEVLAAATGPLGSPAFSSDSAFLATPAGKDIALRDLRDGSFRSLSAPDGLLRGLAFAPGPGSRTTLVSFGGSDRIRLWKTATDESRTFPVPDPQRQAVFSADGRTLVTLGHRGRATLWDVESGQHRWLPSPRLVSIAVSPNGQHFAGGSDDGPIYTWSRDLPDEPTALQGFIDRAVRIPIDPVTGQLVATPAE